MRERPRIVAPLQRANSASAAATTRAVGSRASLSTRGPGSTKSCAALFEQKQLAFVPAALRTVDFGRIDEYNKCRRCQRTNFGSYHYSFDILFRENQEENTTDAQLIAKVAKNGGHSLFGMEASDFNALADEQVALRALGFDSKKEKVRKMIADIDLDGSGASAAAPSERVRDRGTCEHPRTSSGHGPSQCWAGWVLSRQM